MREMCPIYMKIIPRVYSSHTNLPSWKYTRKWRISGLLHRQHSSLHGCSDAWEVRLGRWLIDQLSMDRKRNRSGVIWWSETGKTSILGSFPRENRGKPARFSTYEKGKLVRDLMSWSLESWRMYRESSPAELFRLVKYYKLPRFLYVFLRVTWQLYPPNQATLDRHSRRFESITLQDIHRTWVCLRWCVYFPNGQSPPFWGID